VLQDQEMADISDPLLSRDADVTGSGATLNDNTMDVDIEVLSDGENIRRVSRSSTPMQSPASALSSLLSMIEYATKPLLTDIANGLYNPNLLPDHCGDLFEHKHTMLVQQDIRDTNDNLVAPWQMQDKFRPGTGELLLSWI
jgi:hypothetical protein